jgi:uncharacterized membrane protein
MDSKEKRKLKKQFILNGLRNALICGGIAIVLLTMFGTILAFIRHSSIPQTIYMTYYFGGAFIVMISVPQFYKRNESGKLRGIRLSNPMFGFYDWFGSSQVDDNMIESFEQFKGDGFWLGMMLITVGLMLFIAGVTMENIFFKL